eukprot:TRINITY_DN2818_c0_g1_i1.p1 TRINITY_DN2818_c0_g1~~TRINITY_DN2818_c0_g1_i1.p1  ORF type:complete len:457 (-),score=130.87 TRINITY_DN2818_c0_g1_i1:128-1498(-)
MSSKTIGVVAAAAATAAAVALWRRRRRQEAENTKVEQDYLERVASKATPDPLELPEVHGDGSTTADASEERSAATTPAALSPASAAAKAAAMEGGCPILACPWHDALAFFLDSNELGKVSYTCQALRQEVTVEAPEGTPEGERPSRLLLVPALELKIETAEAELRRVSLEHIRILRVWQRMSFNAVADAVRKSRGRGLRNLDKFVCKGGRLLPADVESMLAPVLANTNFLKLLNLEKNQIGDDTVKAMCHSGILGKVDTLNLRFNLVGDAGAEAIAKCPAAKNLRWVNLKMNRVRDAGALALGKMLEDPKSCMTLLNLRRQTPGLTDRAAAGLAEMLQVNKNLQQLRLRRNRVTDKGATALAAAVTQRMERLCKEIPPWEQVRMELDLEENKVGDAGAVALLRAAEAAPHRARLELLLHGNQATRDSLHTAAAASGEHLDASNPRVSFDNKPEFEI